MADLSCGFERITVNSTMANFFPVESNNYLDFGRSNFSAIDSKDWSIKSKRLLREFCPERISIPVLGIDRIFDSSRTSSLLAFPSAGGAWREIFRSVPATPVIFERVDFGVTRTVSVTPSLCVCKNDGFIQVFDEFVLVGKENR